MISTEEGGIAKALGKQELGGKIALLLMPSYK